MKQAICTPRKKNTKWNHFDWLSWNGRNLYGMMFSVSSLKLNPDRLRSHQRGISYVTILKTTLSNSKYFSRFKWNDSNLSCMGTRLLLAKFNPAEHC